MRELKEGETVADRRFEVMQADLTASRFEVIELQRKWKEEVDAKEAWIASLEKE